MFKRVEHAAIFSAACALGIAGCWHRETQQQKFLEALNRGNAAQASEIWRNMDADSRAALAHNEGINPKLSAAQIQQQVMKHYADDSQTDSGETIENVTPDVGAGGLKSLPEYVGPSSGGAPTVTAAPATMPAN